MVAQANFELHSSRIAQIANSKEVLPGNSTESLSTTRSTANLIKRNNDHDKNGPKKMELKRELGLFSAVSLNVGCMIGSGIFISPSIALELSESVGLCLVIWIACGLISLFGALSFAELSTVVPRSGAEYAYLLEAYGKLHRFWGPLPAFLSSWLHVFILSPSSSAVVILTFSEYICQPFSQHMAGLEEYERDVIKKLIAILGLSLLTYINFTSVKLYVHLQNVFTVSKVLVCAVVIAGGAAQLAMGNNVGLNISTMFEGSTSNPKNIALAFYGCLWSYGGWSAITVVTEEVKNPAKNIPCSILTALPLVTLIYLLMNVAYMIVLTVPEMVSAPAVAVVFGDRMFGVMNFLIPLGVAISTFGCALSSQFTITRLCYVASTEGHMMEAFSYIHMRRLTPAPAVLLQGLLAFFFIVAGDIKSLIAFASFLTWTFYATAMVGLIIMRKTKKDVTSRTYRVCLAAPIITILVALFLFLVPIITDPSPLYFIALFLIALGFIFYVPLVYYKFRPRCMDKFTYFIQALLEVVPPEKSAD